MAPDQLRMAPDQLRSAVESILREELRIVMPESGTDLLDSGLLDSLALVDLIATSVTPTLNTIGRPEGRLCNACSSSPPSENISSA